MRILSSAFKHGLDESDITAAWNAYLKQFIERDDPLKVIRLGFDNRGRLLEVGGEIYADGTVKIFHAMPARRRYVERL